MNAVITARKNAALANRVVGQVPFGMSAAILMVLTFQGQAVCILVGEFALRLTCSSHN